MSDDVRALQVRIYELTGRVNQLNLEKMNAEYRARSWKRYYFLTVFIVVLDMLYTYATFGRWGVL